MHVYVFLGICSSCSAKWVCTAFLKELFFKVHLEMQSIDESVGSFVEGPSFLATLSVHDKPKWGCLFLLLCFHSSKPLLCTWDYWEALGLFLLQCYKNSVYNC